MGKTPSRVAITIPKPRFVGCVILICTVIFIVILMSYFLISRNNANSLANTATKNLLSLIAFNDNPESTTALEVKSDINLNPEILDATIPLTTVKASDNQLYFKFADLSTFAFATGLDLFGISGKWIVAEYGTDFSDILGSNLSDMLLMSADSLAQAYDQAPFVSVSTSSAIESNQSQLFQAAISPTQLAQFLQTIGIKHSDGSAITDIEITTTLANLNIYLEINSETSQITRIYFDYLTPENIASINLNLTILDNFTTPTDPISYNNAHRLFTLHQLTHPITTTEVSDDNSEFMY